MDAKKKPSLNVCGPVLRRLRNQRTWSQAQLALKCQLAGWDASRDIINRMERGERMMLDRDILILAKVLGVAVEQLFPRR